MTTKAKARNSSRNKNTLKAKAKPIVRESPEPIAEVKPKAVPKKIYKCIGCLSLVEKTAIGTNQYFVCRKCGRREKVRS